MGSHSRTTGTPAPTRDCVLSLLLRLGDATAAALAGELNVSVQVTRRHLRALEEEGLVESSPSVEGPGRPSNHWQLTAAGHSRFHDGGQTFALGLLQSLASLPSEAMGGVLRRQTEQKAADYRGRIGQGPLQQRLERLVELRRVEGYVAELRREQDPEQGSDTWLIHEYHCSVMRIAEEFPMVCDEELQLIRHTFPDCDVERVHWRLEEGHSCGFRLSERPA